MSPQLAEGLQRNASELHAMLSALGALDTVFFRGVGPGGYDIYGAKFAKGFAEIRLLMGADGKIENMLFRPDGDDKPGGFAACSDEPTLKPASGTAPIKLHLYNAHGTAIRLFELDAQGRRIPFGAIGDERSAGIPTYVGRPWVVTDASGQCLEVILPGQRTRFVNVQPAGEPHADRVRLDPDAVQEDIAPIYRRGEPREPNYDQMTRGGDANAPATAAQPGHPGEARTIARHVVPRRDPARQRPLHRAFRQRLGRMAHRPGQGRPYRTRCDRAAVLGEVPSRRRAGQDRACMPRPYMLQTVALRSVAKCPVKSTTLEIGGAQ
jgi:hypothetical protein